MNKLIHPLLKYSLVLGCVLAPDSVLGQIVPDATLRVNSSVTQSSNKFTINGGTQVGGNLFHSFQQFNVPTGTEAFFNNAPTIENIFTRVTGGSISNIDGILRANGSANLFLLNPNGIMFGPNARLNIGGSFIGSSASSIKFADGSIFDATNPQTAPLLTVNVPVGLQFGNNPGGITVQGSGHNWILPADYLPVLRGHNSGLQVQTGKTLALVGGTLALNGGVLTAESGRIELGSVNAGLVSLNPTTQGFTLSYAGVPSFGDIQLLHRALADVSGAPAGSIQVQGRSLSISDGSIIGEQNWGMQPGGDIRVNATESLSLSGTGPNANIRSALSTESIGSGKSGDISVSTGRLMVQDGATIASRTFSGGKSGNIDINAAQLVQVSGFAPINPQIISNIGSYTFSAGIAGDVSLSTQNLSILNGASVSVISFGSGLGGNLTVNADNIQVIGTNQTSTNASSSRASSLSAASFDTGNAGIIKIKTKTLTIQDSGIVSTSIIGTGSAGSININASQSVFVDGKRAGALAPSEISSSVSSDIAVVRSTFGLNDISNNGDSGDVTINTPIFRVTNGALVDVRNEGVGKGGTLQVNAGRVLLDHQGSLTATTASGVGGNITLQLKDFLLLRNGSQITTSALGKDNGGNITIDTGTLVALENSDISANAQQGFGGRVIINAKGIFGTQYRQQLTPQSDITASSSLGASFSGVVQINTPDVNPSSATVALPATVLDPSHQITARCAAQKGNNFVVTGRGGLPEDPTSTLRGATLWADLRRVGGDGETRERDASLSSLSSSSPPTSPTPIIEATGWMVDEHGLVELVTQGKESSQHQPWQKTTACENL